MNPKQKYDERKRLRLENDLRAEQRRSADFDREEEVDQRLSKLLHSFERIADVMELWADRQGEKP
jgi:hypothetical protein